MRQSSIASPSTWSPDRHRRPPASGRSPWPSASGLIPIRLSPRVCIGVREGLLELHWDLLCPVCRISAQVTDTLREIAEHAHCQACHLDFELDFANSIELIFRVHPEIREAELGTYCIGGPAHSPHVVAQMRVAPHERIELELDLPDGSYRLRGPQFPWSVDFVVREDLSRQRWDIDLVAGPPADRPSALRSGGAELALQQHGRARAVDSRRADRAAEGRTHGGPRRLDAALSRAVSPARSSPPAGLPRFRA